MVKEIIMKVGNLALGLATVFKLVYASHRQNLKSNGGGNMERVFIVRVSDEHFMNVYGKITPEGIRTTLLRSIQDADRLSITVTEEKEHSQEETEIERATREADWAYYD